MNAKLKRLPSGAYEVLTDGYVFRGVVKRLGGAWIARRPRGEEVGSLRTRKDAVAALIA